MTDTVHFALPEPLAERIAAAAVDAGLADAAYASLSSPVGRLLVVQTTEGVCRIGFEEEPEDRILAGVAARIGPRVVRSRSATAAVLDLLAGYLEGERDDLPVPVDLRLVGGAFRREALEALRRVPRGEMISYGELARRAGRPRAVRATGSACATNPVPIVVPCHRVVPSGGGLGRYAGGSARKRALLALEGAAPTAPRP